MTNPRRSIRGATKMNTTRMNLQRTLSPSTLQLARGFGISSLLCCNLLLTACGARVEAEGNPASSQTHWLQGCDSASECGGLECLCGVCTKSCEDNAECSSLGESSVCTSLGASCEGNEQSVCSKECDENRDCGDEQACTDGVCHPSVASVAPSSTVQPVSSGPVPSGSDAGTPPVDSTPSNPSYALGHACADDDECESGACRTETCFDEDAVCVAVGVDLECNTVVVEYCGCDGVTFEGASGGYGCAGGRYAYVGACGNQLQPAGASCNVHEDCESGTCEGVGCGAFEGKCAEADRACEDDLRNFCDCDGNMFWGRSGCPGDRYTEDLECPYKAADGDTCEDHDDCASGICEGEGCDVPGRCVAANRLCTDDLVPFCGCDGMVFYGSSSCPEGRYDDALACQAPEGEACNTNDDCASAVCEGQGCGELEGICAPSERGCTEDEVPYCTCDGTTVYGSSSCPEVRYATEGECE
jgi:hypothetical protein